MHVRLYGVFFLTGIRTYAPRISRAVSSIFTVHHKKHFLFYKEVFYPISWHKQLILAQSLQKSNRRNISKIINQLKMFNKTVYCSFYM